MPQPAVWVLHDHDIELVQEEIEDLSDLIDSWTAELVRLYSPRSQTRLIPFENAKTKVTEPLPFLARPR
jgi:hypothetical protein